MPPPSPLQIATSSLNRLIKEEASYHKELSQQEGRISKLEASEQDEDGNREFLLRQERRALEETKAVFPNLRGRISDAVAKVEGLMDAESAKGGDQGAEMDNAKAAVEKGKAAAAEGET